MKFVKAKYEIWDTGECSSKTILQTIERAAKVCYKSEGNITETSAEPFVKGLIKRGHTSCLEHGSIYLKIDIQTLLRADDECDDRDAYLEFISKCQNAMVEDESFNDHRISGRYEFFANGDVMYFYTNARFVYEKCPVLFWDIILDRKMPEYISLFTPEKNDPYRRQTVLFTADQRITEEFIRHRVASPNKESTRYCCYSSPKHGAELTFIIPPKLKDYIWDGDRPEYVFYADSLKWKSHNKMIDVPDVELLLNAYACAETVYSGLTKNHGWRAEEARIALPLGTKADLVLTNSLIDWCNGRPEPVDSYNANIDAGEVIGKRIKGFFGLRTDTAAHPQARELAIPLMNDFKERGWLKEIE